MNKGFLFVKEQRAQHGMFNFVSSLAALKTMEAIFRDHLTLGA
jgi:hypothetical protein